MIAPLLLVVALGQSTQPPRDVRPLSRGTATIAGMLTSDDRRPLRRARVTINGAALEMGRTVISGEDGSFFFEGLPPGTYQLSAAKAAYVPMNFGASRAGHPGVPLVLAPGESRRVAFSLSRGAVITGAVLDAAGQPVQGIVVKALARAFVPSVGDYRYSPAGVSSLATDDRGAYRIFGLPAGDYVVAAEPQMRPQALAADPIRTMTGGQGSRFVALTKVFHPAAVELSSATHIIVRAGEERPAVDIQLQYVPLAALEGSAVVPPEWKPAEVGIAPMEAAVGPAYMVTHADDTGRFSFAHVPPGRYRLLARSVSRGGTVLVAAGEVTMAGEDVTNVALSLQAAPEVSGLIVFRGDRPPPVFGVTRTTPPALSRLLEGGGANATTPFEVDGVRFTLQAPMPGPLRVSGAMAAVRTPLPVRLTGSTKSSPGGWWLQSLSAGGVELLDTIVDLRRSIDGAAAVFSDHASEVSGHVTGADPTALAGAYVIAFTTDRSRWFFQSRRIVAARTDVSGQYAIHNLPPGEYRIVVATDLEPLKWYDPAVLDRLLPLGTPVVVEGTEAQTVDVALGGR